MFREIVDKSNKVFVALSGYYLKRAHIRVYELTGAVGAIVGSRLER
jgi:hypothetical protein